jgi:hypothetical protein
VIVDVAGDDTYEGGLSPCDAPEIEARRRVPQAFGEGTFTVRSDSPATIGGFLAATSSFRLEFRDGTLLVWDSRDGKVAAALEKGERPEVGHVRERATRIGGRVGSASEAAIDRFCWERRRYVVRTDGEDLLVLAEDTPALGHLEGLFRPSSLASGFFGIGVLHDLAGNDRYRVRRNGIGEGLYGAGVLVDHAGDDEYVTLREFGQGCGHVGVGALIDLAGNDTYRTGSVSQ